MRMQRCESIHPLFLSSAVNVLASSNQEQSELFDGRLTFECGRVEKRALGIWLRRVHAKPGQDYMKRGRQMEHSAVFFGEVRAVLLMSTCMKLSNESGIQSARKYSPEPIDI